jgi:phenylpropionate dioxygenase-like ring-hydroxylating dioxygenase large terminal subunit
MDADPRERGQRSVARLPAHWFIACRSGALGRRPHAVTLQGVPLVLFRARGGAPAALEDRCPHRNVPLSAGRVRGGELECAYHGWRFDGAGRCVAVPGLEEPPAARAVRGASFACAEQDGYVWIRSGPGAGPGPFRFPHLGEPGYAAVRREYEVRSTLHAALENALDVPHTAFLHGGLFRTARARSEIEVVVRRWSDRCEAEFLGEPRPGGVAARLLAPRGGVVTHVDRFLLPSIAQVEYRLGEGSHLVVTTAMTPVSELVTRLFTIASFRLPLPRWLVGPVLTPAAERIFRQDERILRLQSANVERFGGERFASTPLDVLGPQIWRLLRQAERGEVPAAADAPEHEHRVRMRV